MIGATRKIASQEGEFLNFYRPLMTDGLPLIKSVFTPLAKKVLVPLGLATAASPTDAAIQKKIYGLKTIALIIANEEMDDIVKIVKSAEESGLLIKGVSETIKNVEKEQKCGFLLIILGTIAASFLGDMLAGKPKIPGQGVIRADEGKTRLGQDF